MATPPLKQSSMQPPSYPARASVGNDRYDWFDSEYKPVEHTDPIVDNKPTWADDKHVPFLDMLERKCIDRDGRMQKIANCTTYDFRVGRFVNPAGKTGISGRGLLGQWGGNFAADVIVTKTEAGKLWVLLCEKQVGDDASALCFPAGIVEPGESVPAALRRELCEEALDDDGTAVDQLFSSCKIGCIYAGIVDDWRNTDHAWMMTQAHHYHASPDVASQLKPTVNDKEEIKTSAWYMASDVTTMYASHKDWLDKVIAWHDTNVAKAPFVSHAKPQGVVEPFVSHAGAVPPVENAPVSKKRLREDEEDAVPVN